MKKLVLTAIAGLLFSSSVVAAPLTPLMDGQSVVVGSSSDCAARQCVRIERGGDLVYSYAIVKGTVKSVYAIEMPRDAKIVSTTAVWSGGNSGGASSGVRIDAGIPSPPSSSFTGSLSQSTSYLAGGSVITVITIFVYQNGTCIDVSVFTSKTALLNR